MATWIPDSIGSYWVVFPLMYILIFLVHFPIDWFIGWLRGVEGLADVRTKPPSKWLNFVLGGIERTIALTLWVSVPKLLAAFIGAWVALKFAANWQRRSMDESESTSDKASGVDAPLSKEVRVVRNSLVALIGSAISFGVTILIAVVIYPDGLIELKQPQ